jgi:SAM-dependent methyltransferase
VNKFLTYNDKLLTDFVEMPIEWWSRPYEYAFVADYLGKNQVIVDAGCGIEHPFKWYAAARVKKVIAIDTDERLLNLMIGQPITQGDPLTLKMLAQKGDDKNIEYIQGSFTTKMEIVKNVDRVFCISVFEHMSPEDQEKAMINFYEMLKPGGVLVMTLDYPMAKPDIIYNMAKTIGFELEPATYEADNEANIITRQFGNIKVFTLVGVKPKKEEPKKEVSKKAAKEETEVK